MTVRSESTKQIFWLVLIGLIVRLVALPFVHTDDADAVTRVFMAYKWLQEPHWIVSDVWLPLHLYMNAFIIRLSGGDLIYAPKLVNILFAVATVIPLYKFTENEFKTTDNILEIIQAEKDKNDSLVLVQDFIGWDKTYFIGIRSGIAPDHIFFVNGARHGKVYAADMARVVNKSDKGILVKKNRSKMDRHMYFLNDSVVEVRKLSRYMILSPKYKNGDLTLYTYRLDGKAPSVFYEYRKIFNEHTNEILQIEQKIKNDSSWYRSTVNQAEKRGIEADTMLRLNAIYLFEQKQKK
jgi:hypothetical protein